MMRNKKAHTFKEEEGERAAGKLAGELADFKKGFNITVRRYTQICIQFSRIILFKDSVVTHEPG